MIKELEGSSTKWKEKKKMKQKKKGKYDFSFENIDEETIERELSGKREKGGSVILPRPVKGIEAEEEEEMKKSKKKVKKE